MRKCPGKHLSRNNLYGTGNNMKIKMFLADSTSLLTTRTYTGILRRRVEQKSEKSTTVNNKTAPHAKTLLCTKNTEGEALIKYI